VERLSSGVDTTAEVHFFEATLQTDFQPGVSTAGHKQRQIAGTVWLSQGRKGYSADTRIYYNIVAPGLPSDSTVGFLNNVISQFPNLEINWFVVPK
jgi:hypothetical protein